MNDMMQRERLSRKSIFLLVGVAMILSFRTFYHLEMISHALGTALSPSSIEPINPAELSFSVDDKRLLVSAADEANSTVVVIAHCRESLRFLSHFGACQDHRLQFVIMSKCNAKIPRFPNMSDCIQVQRIENCGTQEYAYFKYVQDNYDSLPPMVAFLQGGAWTENPHLFYDISNYIPGTYYSDLTRYVNDAWHMNNDSVELAMIRRVAPQILNETLWWASWRSQFMVSRRALQRIPLDLYHDFNQKFCSNSCQAINCGTETWFSAMFECSDTWFQGAACRKYEHHLAPKVIPDDFRKDSVNEDTPTTQELLAWSTMQTTCDGTKTMLVAGSTINGRLICVEHDQSRTSVKWWHDAIYQLYAEPELISLPDYLEWRWKIQCKRLELKPPSWI